ncbi:MAG: hypothetical protein ACOCP4_06805 [Candidatus Woesearchaeota archaeon]
MKVGIHKGAQGVLDDFLKKYALILEYNNIDYIVLDINDQNFWDHLNECDLFIIRSQTMDGLHEIALTLIPIIEKSLNIKTLPDFSTYWHYEDKIRQYFLLIQYDFPVVKSYVFWSKSKAIHWAHSTSYPKVFKLKKGAGAANVKIIKSRKDAIKIIDQAFSDGFEAVPGYFYDYKKKLGNISNFRILFQKTKRFPKILKKLTKAKKSIGREYGYVFFQEFLPGNTFDVRISVIGDIAFGFIRYVRKNDFRASGSGKIDYNPELVDSRCIKIAFNVSKKLGFQSMAYDFIFDENNSPKIVEISWTFVDKAIFSCYGYWDDKLIWHQGHFWPQYLQLKNSLNIPNFEQPPLDYFS